MRTILINDNNEFKIDDVDLKIIECLQSYGRMTDSDVAKIVGVSNDTVKRRRVKLEEVGIIKIKALINPKTFGFMFKIHAAITVKPMLSMERLIDKLNGVDGVYFIASSFGPSHNILVHFQGKTREILQEFIEWMRKQEEVQDIDTDMIYDVVKSGYREIPAKQLL